MSTPLTTTFTTEGKFIMWPMNLGIAATVDTELLETYGKILSEEHREIGFANLLGPQIDLTSDPPYGRRRGCAMMMPIL